MILGKRPKKDGDPVHTEYGSSQAAGEGLEREYEELVRAQLARLGISMETVEVEVRPAGAMKDGRNIYLGMVRLVRWEPRTSLRLLVALPLLEAKTRQALETMWLTDVSYFGGLWVHASQSLRTPEVLGEIREAVMQLELGVSQSQPPAGAHGWSASVQAELEDPARKR